MYPQQFGTVVVVYVHDSLSKFRGLSETKNSRLFCTRLIRKW